MKTFRNLSLIMATAVALTAPAAIIVDFGESNAYVTGDTNMVSPTTPAGNFGFSGSNVSPSSGYSGPTYWGGAIVTAGDKVGASATAWRVTNNDSNTGGFDSITAQMNSANVGSRQSMVFIFSSLAGNFTIDNTASSTFTLNARRLGGQAVTGETGLRWVIQDTTDNYYISDLNNSTAAGFGSNYSSGTTAVSQTNLVSLGWNNYDPTSGILSGIGSAIADETTFFASTQFKSAGFWYQNARDTSTGNMDMRFADFSLVAIPEPGTLALFGLAGVAALAFARRRS